MDPEELDTLQDAIGTLFSGFAAGRGEVTADLSAHKSLLTARTLAAAARIEDESDGAGAELRAGIGTSDRLRVAANQRFAREQRQQRPKQGEWLAYGRLLSADGEPAGGFRVRVVDPSRKPTKLGEATSDEFGEWSVAYAECPPDNDKGESSVGLRIYGQRNKLVYASEGDFTLGPNPVEFLEIVLPPGAAPGGGGTAPPGKGSIRITPPKAQPPPTRPVRPTRPKPPPTKPGGATIRPAPPAKGGKRADGGKPASGKGRRRRPSPGDGGAA
jgi:hypothetical protein